VNIRLWILDIRALNGFYAWTFKCKDDRNLAPVSVIKFRVTRVQSRKCSYNSGNRCTTPNLSNF
jgi:hypothetical protein